MKKTAGIIFRSVILILVGITLGLILASGHFFEQGLGFSQGDNNKIAKVLELVRQKYVDSVNVDSVEGVAANNLLQNLDPHSMYLPPKQAQAINEKLEGGFDGFGIEYQLLRDTLVITQVYNNSPAAKAGLISGDRIIDVNNQRFSGTGLTTTRVDKLFTGA